MGRRSVTSADDLTTSALRVIGRSGLLGLSSRAVAAEAGIAVGTVYRYVPDLRNLLDAAAEQVHLKFVERMATAAPDDRPLLAAVPRVAAALVDLARTEPRLTELLALPVEWGGPGDGISIRDWIAGRVARAITDEEILATDPQMVAAAAYGLVAGVLQRALSVGSEWVSAEKVLVAGIDGLLVRPTLPPR